MRVPVHHVDRFFLLFDAPPPVTCLWLFAVEGEPLDEARWRAAVVHALARHPRAASRLRREDGRLWWEPMDAAAEYACLFDEPLAGPSEEAAESERLAAVASAPFDPDQGPLLRLHWIRAGAFPARLVFRFHHALTDGTGSLVFLREVLDAYNGVPAPPASAEQGGPRAPLVAGTLAQKLALLGRLVSLHARRSSARHFALPARLYDRSRRPDGGLAQARLRVPAERLARLHGAARARGAGLTEVLLAALALAADREAAERGQAPGMLRVAVTQDLRSRRDGPILLENRSAAFPVWIGPGDRRGHDHLLRSLRGQVRECLRARAAAGTALFSELLRLPVPLARRLLLPAALSSRVADSFAFGNLGTLGPSSPGGPGWFHLGQGCFTTARVVVRPAEGLGALVSAVVLNGTLEIGLSYLTGLIEPAEAERYLARTDVALEDLASLAPEPSASA